MLKCIIQSNLNFVLSESPYGVKISIKNSFRKHLEAKNSKSNDTQIVFNQTVKFEFLENQNKKLEREITNAETIIKDLRQKSEVFRKESKDHSIEIDNHILNEKKLQKQIKERDKEIYDIKKELTKVTEQYRDATKEVSELKVKVNQEKKEKVKLIKKEQKIELANIKQDASSQQTVFNVMFATYSSNQR